MKKQYSKPILFAESFELAEHISSGCGSGVTMNHAYEQGCTFTVPETGLVVFLANNTACAGLKVDPEEAQWGDPLADYTQNAYCYTVATAVLVTS